MSGSSLTSIGRIAAMGLGAWFGGAPGAAIGSAEGGVRLIEIHEMPKVAPISTKDDERTDVDS